MAIAVNGGHVNRALEFYRAVGKYFIIGGTIPWDDEATPPSPQIEDFKLKDVVGLKRIDNAYMVIPTDETEDVISYRNQNWKKVVDYVSTKVSSTGVTAGSSVVPVEDIAGLTIGSKIRVGNIYEGTIKSISGLLLTLDINAPEDIKGGSTVIGGALVEGAKYVYVDCYLNYDEFPLVTYRQIGLCTGVLPNTSNILRAAKYTVNNADEFENLGVLEVLDNRKPNIRDTNQRELISLVIEF